MAATGGGAMAEFARWPTERKVLAFAAVGLVLGLLYWRFGYRALDERLESARSEHDNKVSTNRKLAEDIPKYEQLRTHMARLRELIEKNQTALPSEAEVPAFFETLQHKVNESGVEIHRWTNRPEEPIESFVKVPVDVEMTGTFMQIKRFFASLIQDDVRTATGAEDKGSEDRERIVSIENLALSTPTVRNREIVLNAKFTAVTFRQEDKAAGTVAPGSSPPAVPKPAAPRPAAPATPSAPPPPLPSASTPAGAKQRVENSLEKGDARNRKAAGAADAKPGAGSDRLKGGL
jgi:type IV pilus assembly protein PilO